MNKYKLNFKNELSCRITMFLLIRSHIINLITHKVVIFVILMTVRLFEKKFLNKNSFKFLIFLIIFQKKLNISNRFNNINFTYFSTFKTI